MHNVIIVFIISVITIPILLFSYFFSFSYLYRRLVDCTEYLFFIFFIMLIYIHTYIVYIGANITVVNMHISHKSSSQFFLESVSKIIISIFIFPILSPLLSFYFFRRSFIISWLYIKYVPSSSNSSKSSSSSSNNFNTSASFCASFLFYFFCYCVFYFSSPPFFSALGSDISVFKNYLNLLYILYLN
jgi:hypothetical protein